MEIQWDSRLSMLSKEMVDKESVSTIGKVFSRSIGSWRNSDFWVKLTHWEFWDFGVVYALTALLHVWQSLKAGSFFYFSAANPGLENSGFLGERKSTIMEKIPPGKQPAWFLAEGMNVEEIQQRMRDANLTYPIIAKPNVGERGFGVVKIDNEEALVAYVQQIHVPFLVQAYAEGPVELGVFYHRIPSESVGKISSIVVKSFLEVEGNGVDTLAGLVEANPRARFVKPYLSVKHARRWNSVIPKGESIRLEDIGNHCRGTTFLNGNDLITPTLEQLFDNLSKQIPGFYFGRYDLRARSLEALETGDFQIVELNGAGAEPAHIYQPGFSFLEGQKVLLHHWRILYRISRINQRNGVKFWTFAQALDIRKNHQKALSGVGV